MPNLSASTVYNGLFSRFQNSPVVGSVPLDGNLYGITTGSAGEYARLGTVFANQESGFNPNLGPPNATETSYGLFQYDHSQVPGGNAFNPNASMDAFVRDVGAAVLNNGILNSGNLGRWFSQTTFNVASNQLYGANSIADGPVDTSQGSVPAQSGFNSDGSLTYSAPTSTDTPNFQVIDQPGNTSNLTGGLPQEGDTLNTGPIPSDQLSGGIPTTGDSVAGTPASLEYGGSQPPTTQTGQLNFQEYQGPPLDGSTPSTTPSTTPSIPGTSSPGSPVPSTGNGGSGPGSGSGGAGGAGGGMPLDIQTLGPGTTQPIQGWINEALKTGTGWVGQAVGTANTAISAAETFGSNLFGGITNWFVRGFLIFLGAILIFIGLIVLMWDHGGEQVAHKAAKAAAA
jgi:hypothetical protein